MELVWTRDGKHEIDTIHRAGCGHTNMAYDINPLTATSTEDAQREVAGAMGWNNWPEPHDAEFDLRIAPCAR